MASGGYVKKSSRSWVLPSLKPFKCTNADCTKSFLNQNGLKYHKAYGTCVKKTAPNAQSSDRPYYCYDAACAKAYKNMNGLRYHYLHSAEHGERGMNMLNDGTHPPFLDRRSGASSSSSARRDSVNNGTAPSLSSSAAASASPMLQSLQGDESLGEGVSSSASSSTSGRYGHPYRNTSRQPGVMYQEDYSTSGGNTPLTNPDEFEHPSSYIPSQPMNIRGAEQMQSPSTVSRELLDAVNLFSDRPEQHTGSIHNHPLAPFNDYTQYQQPQYQMQYQAASVPNDWSGQPSSAFYDVSNILLPYMNGSYYSVSQPSQFNSAFAPPPMTFGARTHRFHPYSTSTRSYVPTSMQSPPALQPSPRHRRLSL